MTIELPILHFNDVYRVGPQKIQGKGTVDVTQFASMLDDLRDTWPLRPDGARDGLVLFSGDLFAPSVESSVTRGSHMVPVINELAPDVAVTGNHEFDFGYPQLAKLIDETKFPWVLSNIVDGTTSKVPECLHQYHVVERRGIRIGFIGLVEREWIATVPSWPSNFKYVDMAETVFDLSRLLRDPQGEYRCDLIIALTHSRLPNDIRLARQIGAILPQHQPIDFAATQGADIILGGHDHFYYISRGLVPWKNHHANRDSFGAECDQGDVFVVKSGTDFRELTELILELGDSPAGSVRRKIIKGVRGMRHETLPGSTSSQRMKDILSRTLETVSEALKAPILRIDGPLDLRSEVIRACESASGNWFADVIYSAYGDLLRRIGIRENYGVLLCAGALRGDTVYGPGTITVGDIMEILPFDDSIIALELDGPTIWQAFEAGISQWPAHEGRFPVVSGFNVVWDSRKPPGRRVVRVSLSACRHTNGSMLEEIPREDNGRKYVVVTREYMAEGYDGYCCLKNQRAIIDKEQGQMMSTVIRKFFSEDRPKKSPMPRPRSGFIKRDTRIRVVTGQAGWLCRAAFKQMLQYWRMLATQVNAKSPRATLILSGSKHAGYESRDSEKPSVALLESSPEEDEACLLYEDSHMLPGVDGRLRDVGRLAL